MTRKPSYRYKCDFCGKTSGSGGHMAQHEKHCTMNPHRECRACRNAGFVQRNIVELVGALGAGDAAGIAALENLAERCPACMLAAIRQSALQRPPEYRGEDDWEPGFRVEWSYKQAQKAFWQDMNEARAEGA